MYKYVIIFFIIQTNIGCTSMNKNTTNGLTAPKAEKIPHKHIYHDDVRIDNYHWLRDDDRKNPKVIDYLNQENSYTDAVLAEQKPLIDNIYNEIVSRLPAKEQSVPYKIDDYWYYSRYASNSEYPIYARKAGKLSVDEQIMVDMNKRAEGKGYFQSNYQAVSPNHEILGFSEDTTGRRQYSLYFKNLQTEEMYADVITDTTGAIVWALDNKTFFYTKKHPVTLLPYRVYRHELGSNVADVLVYEEKDNTFYTSISASTSKQYIFINVGSTTSSEVYVLDANNPQGQFKSFLPREVRHEYAVEELNNNFFVLTNWQAKNFRIMQTDLANSNNKNQWQQVIAHDESTLLYAMQAFNNYLAIEQRSAGIRHISLYNFKTNKSTVITAKENTYTMWLGFNPQQNTDTLRYSYASLTTPFTVYDYDMVTAKQTIMKQNEVVGSYKPDNYTSQRIAVTAKDGVKIPVSLVYKKSNIPLKQRPLLVYGYGSYGSSVDPAFSYSRVSLLDRGFIFAIAHIRGSQANGRSWYEDGKLLNKKNTFTDFIAATKGLLQQGYGDKHNVFAMGGSAGGLLMGAVINMQGMLYKGIVAAVPFVDVVSTMLDEDIPLTTGEFDEWGNPKEKKFYDYMLSYSPYDNVGKQDYPNMLVTTGLHDSQVQYWEPAKWVAKLRDMKTNNSLLIMRTNMQAGHGGASGRYQKYKEIAEDYGFILKLVHSLNNSSTQIKEPIN
ncbi:Protease II [hydrothermal vent metagenome]|uniref:Protease II n=1 Tax=hydrothermal vent metagenome TaxID=652676 RepID=A0A3B0UY86_9ZZZZ